MNTTYYLLQHGHDDHIVLITEETQYTYRDLRQAVAFMAAHLHTMGIQPGDRIGLLSANSFFWVVSYLAILKVGAVSVALPTMISAENLHTNTQFVNCQALCFQKRYLKRVQAANLDDLTLIMDDILLKSWTVTGDVTVITNSQSEAALMLTSGTTAQPKAVRVSQRNIQANTASIVNYLELSAADRMMVVLPFFYCFGSSILNSHLRAGGSLVISNRFAFPETVLNLMEYTECTGFAGVPSMYHTLLRNTTFCQRDMPTLRTMQQAGGKLPSVLIDELRHAMPHANLFVMYGQTEATARLSYLPPDLLDTKLGSIGKGIPGVQLRVVNESGDDVVVGEVGEIIARGDNVTLGYLNDPVASARKYVKRTLRTGDLATVDEEGYIYIVDRMSDFIKPYGVRVSSQKVEGCVMELPDMIHAAAVGVPDMVLGEAIYVYAVTRRNSTLNSHEIVRHCRNRLPRHMIPVQIILVDKLPLNKHSKVLKSELKAQALRDMKPAYV